MDVIFLILDEFIKLLNVWKWCYDIGYRSLEDMLYELMEVI